MPKHKQVELFLTLHQAHFVDSIISGGSNFAIHQRGPQGYRTIFRCVTDGSYVIDMSLLCQCQPVGELSSRQLLYFNEHSTGTDGHRQKHLMILNRDGSIQEVECEAGMKLPFAKDETTWYPQLLLRDDDLAFVYPVYLIDKRAKYGIGEHIADLVGTYRLVANPPADSAKVDSPKVDPQKVIKPFRLEVQRCRRRALKPGE